MSLGTNRQAVFDAFVTAIHAIFKGGGDGPTKPMPHYTKLNATQQAQIKMLAESIVAALLKSFTGTADVFNGTITIAPNSGIAITVKNGMITGHTP